MKKNNYTVNFRLISTNIAQANGIDENIITAQLFNGDEPVRNEEITFYISATDASFSNGQQSIKSFTDKDGESHVSISSKEISVPVFAVSNVNETQYIATVTSLFNTVISTDAELKGYIVTDNAIANGDASNTMLYILQKNNAVLPGNYIHFSASSKSGKAVLNPTMGITDASGQVVLNVTNTEVESVIVNADAIALALTATPKTINFSERIPGNNITLVGGERIGVNLITNDHYFIKGHYYSILFTPFDDLAFLSCPIGTYYNLEKNACAWNNSSVTIAQLNDLNFSGSPMLCTESGSVSPYYVYRNTSNREPKSYHFAFKDLGTQI